MATEQFGFLVDTINCVGCKACEVACKNRNELDSPGPRLRKVTNTESGTFPDTRVVHLSLSCMHCEHPACVEACPAGAVSKREDGTVVADRNLCIGCQTCATACPYGVPQYREDDGTMIKCDGCIDRRAAGLAPACAHTCFYNALYAGPLSELEAIAEQRGAVRMEGETGPAVFIVETPERTADGWATDRTIAPTESAE